MSRACLLGMTMALQPFFSWAACTSPAGAAGQFQYISGDYKLCNGSAWNTLAESTTATTCSAAGSLITSGTNVYFCNGTNLVSLMGTGTDGACSVAGMMNYDAVNLRLEICNGTSWTYKVTGSIVLAGSGRRWVDGNYALSCNKYKNPDPGYTYSGSTGNGVYTIDPDGAGADLPFDVHCDMTTDGGGWTLVYAATGADGEQAMVSDTEVLGGNPLSYQHYNLNRSKKIKISAVSTTSMINKSGASPTWIKWNAAMFDANLNTANSCVHNLVTVTSSNGTTSSGYAGYSNYNIAGGGDFGVTNTANFDHHSANYWHLNNSCTNSFFYSYSQAFVDGDAGYDVNTALGDWAATNACEYGEGGGLIFFAAMR